MATIKSLTDGKVYDIPDDKLEGAEAAGFKILTPEERQKEIDISQASVAGGLLEKGLSAATLSGSRYAEQIIGDAFNIPSLSKEAQATRSEAVEKYQPELGVASEIVGTVAPIVLSGGLAAPEVAAVQGAKTAATAGKTALTVADAFNPVGAIAKLGTSTAELAEPAIAKSLTGLAATSPRIAQGLTKAGSMAAGGALEGAAFGVGNALDEHALGSEQSLGEAMLINAGIGTLLGGGVGGVIGGLGGLISKVSKPAAKVEQQELVSGLSKEQAKAAQSVRPNDILETMGEAPKSVDEAVLNSADNEAQKQVLTKGMEDLKPHAQVLIKDSNEVGLPIFPNQLSKNKDIAIKFEQVAKSPSLAGQYVRQQLAQAWEKASNIVNPIFETGEKRTALEIGEDLQSSILKKADDMIESYKAKYKELGLTEKAIPVSDKTSMRVAKNLLKVSDIKDGHAPSEVYQVIKLLDREGNTLENITGIQKSLNAYIYNPMNDLNKKRIASYVKSRIDAIYENTIKKQFSKNDQKELFKLYRDSRKEFAQAIEHFSDISSATGKSKIRSPLSFVEHFKNNINAEALTKKLFKKDNFRFVESFKNKFPKEWEMIKNYQKKNMMVIKDQTLDVKATLKNINGLSKEMRGILFNPKELDALEKVVRWSDSFPPEFNPSRSGSMVEWTIGNVPKIAYNNIRDAYRLHELGKVSVSAGDSPKKLVSEKLLKITNTINKGVDSTSKFILDKGGKYSVPASSILIHDDEEATEETMDKIRDAYEDVNGLNDRMTNSTGSLAQYAPNTANGYKMKSAQTLNYLYNKLPKYDSSLLSPKHKPSKAEIYKFNLHFQTVKDPFKTMKKAKFGALLPEEMDTLKNVYPDILEKTQLAILNQMQEIMSDDTLSYQNKIGLSSLLEKPLINSLQPKNIAMNQIKTNNQKQAEVQKGISKAPNLKSSYMTSFQKSGDDVS